MCERTKYFHNCLGVFQGGGCRAAAFVGAYLEAVDKRGVSFSEVAGTSAGSIIAALIGAGATPGLMKDIVESLDFNKLLAKPSFLSEYRRYRLLKPLCLFSDKINVIRFLGLHSSKKIHDWVEYNLRLLLPTKPSPIKFQYLIFPTSIIATDLKTHQIKIWSSETTPQDEVASAVQASCSIPFFFQPIYNRFVDGGLLSNLPAFVVQKNANPLYNKILAFTLKSDDQSTDIKDFGSFINSFVETIVGGSQDLQLKLQKSVHLISIPTGDVKATDFKRINKDIIGFLIENGRKATAEFFDNEVSNILDSQRKLNICEDEYQSNNAIVQSTNNPIEEVIISESETDWIHCLFPTLLYWRRNGAKITVLLKRDPKDDLDEYRRRLIEVIGADIVLTERIERRCFVFNPNVEVTALAVVYYDANNPHFSFDSSIYQGVLDFPVINSLSRTLYNTIEKSRRGNLTPPRQYRAPTLKKIEEGDVITLLRRVIQYGDRDIEIRMEKLNVTRLQSLTRYVKGYKFRQIGKLIEMYNEKNVPLFYPAKLIYDNDKESIITPPVIEKHNNKYILIAGLTRALYCYRNNINDIYAFVVENVKAPLPAKRPNPDDFRLNHISICDKKIPENIRYIDLNRQHFRKIELAVRDSRTCLK